MIDCRVGHRAEFPKKCTAKIGFPQNPDKNFACSIQELPLAPYSAPAGSLTELYSVEAHFPAVNFKKHYAHAQTVIITSDQAYLIVLQICRKVDERKKAAVMQRLIAEDVGEVYQL